MCRAGEITQQHRVSVFQRKKKSCRDPLHSIVDYAMLLNCTHKCWGDHFYVILLFLTKTNNKSPSCSPSASIQWVDCILFSQVSSLLLLTYPEAVETQAGQSIGFNRVMLRGCWARSSVPDWEHTELVRVHQGTENTQSFHSPCDFLFQESGALQPGCQHEHHRPFSSLPFILKQRCQ